MPPHERGKELQGATALREERRATWKPRNWARGSGPSAWNTSPWRPESAVQVRGRQVTASTLGSTFLRETPASFSPSAPTNGDSASSPSSPCLQHCLSAKCLDQIVLYKSPHAESHDPPLLAPCGCALRASVRAISSNSAAASAHESEGPIDSSACFLPARRLVRPSTDIASNIPLDPSDQSTINVGTETSRTA